MTWIDLILATAFAASVASNIPLLLDPRTVIPRAASVPKALACSAVTPCYLALGVYWTFGASLILCLCKWLVVVFKGPRSTIPNHPEETEPMT